MYSSIQVIFLVVNFVISNFNTFSLSLSLSLSLSSSTLCYPISHSIFFFLIPFHSFCFFCFSSLMSTSIDRVRVRGFTLCACVPFFFFALLTCLSLSFLLLPLVGVDPAVAGLGCRLIY